VDDRELAGKLNAIVSHSPPGNRTHAYVLFGIKYREELQGRLRQIVTLAIRTWPEAGVSPSALFSIRYGMKLSSYVSVTQPEPRWLV